MSRKDIMDLIADERNKYSAYLQLCTYYKVDPDPMVLTKCSTKIETLELILKSM
jgi:hypothetical protein